jgi:hypothetical protein
VLQKGVYGAGDEARTRYLHLGKVALYQMSYARTLYHRRTNTPNTPAAHIHQRQRCYYTTPPDIVKKNLSHYSHPPENQQKRYSRQAKDTRNNRVYPVNAQTYPESASEQVQKIQKAKSHRGVYKYFKNKLQRSFKYDYKQQDENNHAGAYHPGVGFNGVG